MFYYRYKNEETKELYAHTSSQEQAKLDGLNLTTEQKAVAWDGCVYLENEVPQTVKEEMVRDTRDNYLLTYVDPVVSNPLRWADLSAEEQKQYADYRRYLLDITDDPAFPDVTVKTFDEFIAVV
ncbi:MAG: hypothetical protein IJV75_00225 [Alphaproteobacteria bacterium]|nr:hypothetical protein [Alphaproteobacteria bacterium]